MKEKRMTIEKLATMVKNGFDDARERVDESFDKMQSEFEEIKDRLIKVENGHIGRIQRLEDDMRIVKTKVGVK